MHSSKNWCALFLTLWRIYCFPFNLQRFTSIFLRNIILKRTFSSYRSALQSQQSAALPGVVWNADSPHASSDKAVKGFAQKRLPPSLSDTSEWEGGGPSVILYIVEAKASRYFFALFVGILHTCSSASFKSSMVNESLVRCANSSNALAQISRSFCDKFCALSLQSDNKRLANVGRR